MSNKDVYLCDFCINNHMYKNYKLYSCIIILIGIFLRCFYFWDIPGGGELHQDEAFAAYNAISVFLTGTDPDGHSFPMYFSSWGSGMNALESYIMIPFFYIFGINNIAIRFPMVISNIISVVVFYLLFAEFSSRSKAIIAIFIFSIMPWHIMISRWALESNLMPSIMLFAVYFLVKSKSNCKFILLSSCFFGISLYAYSACWIIIPIFILISLLYMIKINFIKLDKWICFSGILLLAIGMPALLFCLVNYNIIDELSIFSITIPKLPYFRSGDVNILDFFDHFKKILKILVIQIDGRVHDSFMPHGIYYLISTPFFIYGIKCIASNIKNNINNHVDVIMMIWFFSGFLLGILIDPDITRINIIHIPTIYIIATGVYTVICRTNTKNFYKISIIIAYLFSAIYFTYDYYTRINNIISIDNSKGLKHALQYAKKLAGNDDIYIYKIFHPKILLDTMYDVKKFINTVSYYDEKSKYRYAKHFNGFFFIYTKEDLIKITEKKDIILVSSSKYTDECSKIFNRKIKFDHTIVLEK